MWRRASVQDRAQLLQQSEAEGHRAGMRAGDRVRMLRRKFEARRSDQGGILPSVSASLKSTSGPPADSAQRPQSIADARSTTSQAFSIDSGPSIESETAHGSVQHSTESIAAPSNAMAENLDGPPHAPNSDNNSHVDDDLGHTAHAAQTTHSPVDASQTADDLSSEAQTARASDTASLAHSGSHLPTLHSGKAHTVVAGSNMDRVLSGQTGHNQFSLSSVGSQRSAHRD